MNFLV